MDNKLGPALFIALGIFGIYLVLTGKAQNLINAANGTSSGSSNGSSSSTNGGGAAMSASSGGSYATSAPSPSIGGVNALSGVPQGAALGTNAQNPAIAAANYTYGVGPSYDAAVAQASEAAQATLGLYTGFAPSPTAATTVPGALGYNSVSLA